MWNTRRARARPTRAATVGPVSSVAVSPNGRTALIGGAQGTVAWDLSGTGAPREMGRVAGTALTVAIADNGRGLVLDTDGKVTSLVVPGGLQVTGELPVPGAVDRLAVSADATTALTVTGTTWTVWRIDDPRTPRQHTSAPAERRLPVVAISGDGRTVLVDTTLWDVSDPTAARKITVSNRVGRVVGGYPALDAEGRLPVLVHPRMGMFVWTVEGGEADLAEAVGPGLTGPMSTVAVSADAHTVVAGRADHRTGVWDTAFPGRSALRTTLAGHTDEVSAVAVSADGGVALTASRDGTALVWDLHQPRRVTGGPRRTACLLVGQALDDEAWRTYVPDLPYRDTCAG